MRVVTTFSDPPVAALPRLPPANSHCAIEVPCHVGSPDDGAPVKYSERVCVPASVSILSTLSLSQVMWTRPGCRMMLPTPYDLHWLPAASSLAGSQASATLRPSGLSGMLG